MNFLLESHGIFPLDAAYIDAETSSHWIDG